MLTCGMPDLRMSDVFQQLKQETGAWSFLHALPSGRKRKPKFAILGFLCDCRQHNTVYYMTWFSIV